MAGELKFGSFDPDAEFDIEYRNLPHWFQPGAATFVTMRTADSMPRDVIARWRTELVQWLEKHGFNWNPNHPLPEVESLPEKLQGNYRRQRDRLWNWHLDRCHGACILRRPELAGIVLKSLKHFNGDRYDLASAIVMPNHVHLIGQFYNPTTCRKQCTSWMQYTATRINRCIGGSGEFWQSEPFDHVIRSEEQFFYLRRYIAENGTSANLPETDWFYWDGMEV